MKGDHPITAEQAIEIQNEIQQLNQLLMWIVTHNTSDYPDHWVARPQVAHPKVLSAPFVLLADSLESLREQLPRGLSMLNRQAEDDPVIVEIWL